MADGLCCCIWAHSQSPGTVFLDLVKGWTNMRKEDPLGNLGLAMEDLAWHAGSGLPVYAGILQVYVCICLNSLVF